MRSVALIALSFGYLAMAQMSEAAPRWEVVGFGDLPGWREDDHAAALAAFKQSCEMEPKGGRDDVKAELQRLCAAAAAVEPKAAKAFFETEFHPVRAVHSNADGLLTGYFEPELDGSLTKDAEHPVPVYKRPDDLIDTVAATDRARANADGRLAAMRKTGEDLEPYFTRGQIEDGALAGQGLELLWLKDPIDAYFMHVQGSGSIRLSDGRLLRIGYAGKNGYPYQSIGAALIRRGLFTRDGMSLQSLKAWLREHPTEAREVMNENRSYIFFEARPEAEGRSGPLGGKGTPLTPRRSLAVDTEFHTLGTPMYVNSAGLLDPEGRPFRRLMIAEDVGSAIRGPERGDIFWGTGDAAEDIAGRTKHRGNIFALLPRSIVP